MGRIPARRVEVSPPSCHTTTSTIVVVNTTLLRPRGIYILTSRSDYNVQPAGTLRAAAIHRVFCPMISRHPSTGMNPTVRRNLTEWGLPRHAAPPDMGPDSDLQPRKSYARYHSWKPQFQPGPATTVKDPIYTKLDRSLEAFDRMDARATDRRVSKFRSSPQPDLDRPDISPSLRKIEYPPSRNTMDSFVPSGLTPNVSSAPLRHRTIEYTTRMSDFQSPQRSSMTSRCHSVAPPPAAAAVLSSNLPQTATIVAKQPHQNYQPLPTLPRSDRQPQQPSPPSPLELLPYAALGPFQPLPLLPETAPFAASNLRPQAAIPSSMKKEWETNIQEGEERMEIENIIVEYKAAIETTKPDLKVEMDVRRSLFEDELRLKSKELGKKLDGSYTSVPVIACVFVGLNVTDVTSMNPL